MDVVLFSKEHGQQSAACLFPRSTVVRVAPQRFSGAVRLLAWSFEVGLVDAWKHALSAACTMRRAEKQQKVRSGKRWIVFFGVLLGTRLTPARKLLVVRRRVCGQLKGDERPHFCRCILRAVGSR